jgi:hypothetical protein
MQIAMQWLSFALGACITETVASTPAVLPTPWFARLEHCTPRAWHSIPMLLIFLPAFRFEALSLNMHMALLTGGSTCVPSQESSASTHHASQARTMPARRAPLPTCPCSFRCSLVVQRPLGMSNLALASMGVHGRLLPPRKGGCPQADGQKRRTWLPFIRTVPPQPP